jgi:hypothetical protein
MPSSSCPSSPSAFPSTARHSKKRERLRAPKLRKKNLPEFKIDSLAQDKEYNRIIDDKLQDMEIDFSSLDGADFLFISAFSSFVIEAAYEDKPSAKAWYCTSADTLESLQTARQTAQRAFTVHRPLTPRIIRCVFSYRPVSGIEGSAMRTRSLRTILIGDRPHELRNYY